MYQTAEKPAKTGSYIILIIHTITLTITTAEIQGQMLLENLGVILATTLNLKCVPFQFVNSKNDKDNAGGPWCYVNETRGWNRCNIPVCGEPMIKVAPQIILKDKITVDEGSRNSRIPCFAEGIPLPIIKWDQTRYTSHGSGHSHIIYSKVDYYTDAMLTPQNEDE
ncbi:F2 [Mytilus edulis]|uniref:F2 n=1 Tax=Mytilus edulis TaxID=6550 RepID=A0A8S3Q6T8_MYTED|nr:F2 [Mytilus edulis]